MKRLTWIDSLKGIAILFVIACHCGADGLPSNFARVVGSGAAWVQMFFLLSSALAFSSLDREVAKSVGASWRCAVVWICRRLIRLMPLYFLAVAFACLFTDGATYWLGSEKSVSWQNVLCHLMFLHGLFPHYADSIIGVEWYIGVLVLFYCLVPILRRWIVNFPRAVVGFVVSVAMCHLFTEVAFRYFLPLFDDREIYSAWISSFCIMASLPTLLLGITMGFVFMEDGKRFSVGDNKLFSLSLFVLFALLYHGCLKNENSLRYFNPQVIYAIGFAFVILAMHHWNIRVIDNPVFAFFGRHSYGLYLFHMLFLSIVASKISLPGGWACRYLCCVFATTVFALCSWMFVDRPAGKWLDGVLNRYMVCSNWAFHGNAG